jgi:hypothetical protein
MKKGERQATPNKTRFKKAFSLSQSTGNIFTHSKQSVPSMVKPFGQSTPLRKVPLNRNPSVTLPILEDLSAPAVPESVIGKLGLDHIRPTKPSGTPIRGLNKTPIKKSGPGVVAGRVSVPAFRRKRPDLNRSHAQISLPAVTENTAGKASETPIHLRRKQSEAIPLTKQLFEGRNRSFHSINEMPTAQSLPDTMPQVLFQTRTGIVGGRAKPHNQDSLLYIPHFHTTQYQKLIGVFDGHGEV